VAPVRGHPETCRFGGQNVAQSEVHLCLSLSDGCASGGANSVSENPKKSQVKCPGRDSCCAGGSAGRPTSQTTAQIECFPPIQGARSRRPRSVPILSGNEVLSPHLECCRWAWAALAGSCRNRVVPHRWHNAVREVLRRVDAPCTTNGELGDRTPRSPGNFGCGSGTNGDHWAGPVTVIVGKWVVAADHHHRK
jgi:hypothetical protein